MSFIGNNPKFNTSTHTPQSADPSDPVEGMIYYSDGTPRDEGPYVYKDGSWQRLALGEAGNLSVRTENSAYTLVSTDDFILADSSSSSFTITLPAAGSNEGKIFRIKKTDSTFNLVTIDPNASETIGNKTTWTLATQFENINIVSDGSNWRVISHEADTTWQTYTPTIQGAGTVTDLSALWRRTGDSIEVKAIWTNGTVTAVDSQFSLPSGLTIKSGLWTGAIAVGPLFSGNFSGDNYKVMAEAGDSFVQPIRLGFTTPVAYSAIFNNSEIESLNFTVPITNWESL